MCQQNRIRFGASIYKYKNMNISALITDRKVFMEFRGNIVSSENTDNRFYG